MTSDASSHVLCESAGVPVLRFPAIDATGIVDAVVTRRGGGVSTGPYESLNLGLHVGDDPDAVVVNRARAAATIGMDLDGLVFCNQTHGTNVARVGVEDRGRGAYGTADAIDDTDAVITTDPDVGLVIMVADCTPMVAVDPVARVLACVHAGWRGTLAGVGRAAIAAMVDAGADPERIVVGVGPAISPERYQVGEDVAEAARAAFGDRVERVLRPDGTGRWLFDGRVANRLLLEDAGVQAANIHVADLDTDGEFFSDRAARPCGRFAVLARLVG